MRSFALALGSVALATFFSAPALADCIPGTGLCASAGMGLPIGQVGGQVQIGLPGVGVSVPVPPPPQAYPAPQAYDGPQEDPAVYERPRQRRVVHHRPYRRVAQPNWGEEKLGLDLRVNGSAGLVTSRSGALYGMGGAGAGLRYRAFPHLGFEAGIDLLGGHDYNDMKRFEVAGTAGALVYLNPRSRAQIYLSGGLMLDHARAWSMRAELPESYLSPVATYNHFGGYAGLGLEIFLSRRVSLHLDGRGVVRQNLKEGTPEFVDRATGRSTNTSGAFVGSGGLALYF